MRHSRKITKADETDEFREFWAMWQPKARHTDGRGLARETFFKHVSEGADPLDIVDGARWFLRGVKDREYIPLSSTWLNREAYEDMAEQERGFQQRLSERDRPVASNVTTLRPRSVPEPQIDNEARRRHVERLRSQHPILAVGQ